MALPQRGVLGISPSESPKIKETGVEHGGKEKKKRNGGKRKEGRKKRK
jgi:hypothetical protein